MDIQLAIILFVTFVIHLIGTGAYAFRLAGIRTGKIAIALALFNVLMLVSRTANSLQVPFAAKRVENDLLGLASHNIEADFRLVLLMASVATVAGGLLLPTMQRCAIVGIEGFSNKRSVPRLILRMVTPSGLRALYLSLRWPSFAIFRDAGLFRDIPIRIALLNMVANALWTVSVFAAIYAGHLEPEFRVTASTLSAIINGMATIILFVVIDPYMAAQMDDVAYGSDTVRRFKNDIAWMVASRLVGTFMAQILLVPGAYAVMILANVI